MPWMDSSATFHSSTTSFENTVWYRRLKMRMNDSSLWLREILVLRSVVTRFQPLNQCLNPYRPFVLILVACTINVFHFISFQPLKKVVVANHGFRFHFDGANTSSSTDELDSFWCSALFNWVLLLSMVTTLHNSSLLPHENNKIWFEFVLLYVY